jgi:hypothetical protein
MKIALFLWAKIGRPKSETGDSVPRFPASSSLADSDHH